MQVDPYQLLLAAHILMMVTWLGMDIGVFTSSFWIANPRYGVETRVQMGRLLGVLDMGPRTSQIVILGLGLILATWRWGLQPLGSATPILVAVIEVLLLVWLFAVWQQYFVTQQLARGQNPGRRAWFASGFPRLDLGIRIGVAVVFIILGLLPFLVNAEMLVQAPWLDVKFVLFGLVFLCGVAIRIVSQDFPMVLGQIVRHGSTPEREARLAGMMRRVRPIVLVLWTLIVLIAVIAVTKPF